MISSRFSSFIFVFQRHYRIRLHHLLIPIILLFAHSGVNAQSSSSDSAETIPLRIPDEERLTEISNMKVYQYTEENQGPGIWDRLRMWIRGLLIDWVDTPWVQTLLKVIGAVTFLWVIFLLINQITKGEFIGLISGKSNRSLAEVSVNSESSATSLKKHAQEAANRGDLDLAIRYLYQYSLSLLRKNKLIRWESFKTNSEYLNELRDKPVYNAFRRLTLISEYVDYGEFHADRGQYDSAQKWLEEMEQLTKQGNDA